MLSTVLPCFVLLIVAPGSVRAQDSTCVQLFEGLNLTDLSDDGTFKVGDVIRRFPDKINNVSVTLTCSKPNEHIFLLNRTDLILGTDLKKLPCNGDTERARCRIGCKEDNFADYDTDIGGAISRTDFADPYFNKSHYIISVSEYTRKGASIFTFAGKAFDDDCLNKDQGFNYNIETQSVSVISMSFHGEVSLEQQLDYESENKSYDFNVSVSHSGKMAYTKLTIVVHDEDDMDPEFTNDTYILKIMEENTTLTSLWLSSSPPIHAEDLDKGAGKQNVSYFFEDMLSDNGVFLINNQTGQIKPKRKLDREEKAHYVFIIKAAQDNNQLRSATATLAVEVLDVNDNQPMFSENFYTVTIPENSAGGKSIISVTAIDNDEGENAVTQYKVDDNDYFDINRDTGVVSVKSSADIDREKNHSFNVTIKAVDSQSGIEGGNITLVVTVEDVNDNAPIFTSSKYQFHLSTSKLIGTVKANDADEGNNSVISYIIYDKLDDGKYFTIDNNGNISRSDEEISTTKMLFTIIVVARDHGFPRLESIATVEVSQTLVDGNKVVIGTPLSLEGLKSMLKQLERDIGNLIKLTVKAEDTQSDVHSSGSLLYISATYPNNNTAVNGDVLLSIVKDHMSEIQALFRHDSATVAAQVSTSMTSAEIALIIIAGVIFCGSLLAIVILFRKYQNLKRYNQLNEHLRRRSSLYESQEIKVKMEDETSDYDGSLNTQEVEADSSNVIVGKEGLVTAFSNPIYADEEQTNIKLSSADAANGNNEGEKATDSNDIEETLSSLDDALDTEDVPLPRVDYENTRLKGGDSDDDTKNLIDLNDGEVDPYEATFSHDDNDERLEIGSVQSDKRHENTNDEDENKDDNNDDDPPPDYNVKEVRFSAQVLDTDENKFEPLKVEEIPNTETEDVDGEAQIIDTEENVDDREDNIVPHFVDESDRMDEEIISPVDFLNPENKDDNGANLGTFHFGLDSSHDMEITKF